MFFNPSKYLIGWKTYVSFTLMAYKDFNGRFIFLYSFTLIPNVSNISFCLFISNNSYFLIKYHSPLPLSTIFHKFLRLLFWLKNTFKSLRKIDISLIIHKYGFRAVARRQFFSLFPAQYKAGRRKRVADQSAVADHGNAPYAAPGGIPVFRI